LRPPAIASLLVAPRRAFARAAARSSNTEIAAAYAIPVTLIGAAFALVYAGALLVEHFVANALWIAASIAVQTGSAVLAARLVYRAPVRRALASFAPVLAPQELFFVLAMPPAVLVPGFGGTAVGVVVLVFFAATLAWTFALKWTFFRALDPSAGKRRAAAAIATSYAFVAAFVAGYARALDLFPYPPGRP